MLYFDPKGSSKENSKVIKRGPRGARVLCYYQARISCFAPKHPLYPDTNPPNIRLHFPRTHTHRATNTLDLLVPAARLRLARLDRHLCQMAPDLGTQRPCVLDRSAGARGVCGGVRPPDADGHGADERGALLPVLPPRARGRQEAHCRQRRVQRARPGQAARFRLA
eukprot:746769-Rhodomonas_salina.1